MYLIIILLAFCDRITALEFAFGLKIIMVVYFFKIVDTIWNGRC